ncbi:hypothetical protein BESB_065130 [Besnoitia besnoiti]|uniref:PHD-finger domain-containing protein n=1 Tax=Besnoitia besnoiti TaxID=94643 RepID=A0A2A9MGG3_BESBE|nr:hypothetical protein BESB_065130 [Besnoitia besnoiti]PFH34482.1 hypothetical protein BESB_065130 [Besnoitia besnoiti]
MSLELQFKHPSLACWLPVNHPRLPPGLRCPVASSRGIRDRGPTQDLFDAFRFGATQLVGELGVAGSKASPPEPADGHSSHDLQRGGAESDRDRKSPTPSQSAKGRCSCSLLPLQETVREPFIDLLRLAPNEQIVFGRKPGLDASSSLPARPCAAPLSSSQAASAGCPASRSFTSASCLSAFRFGCAPQVRSPDSGERGEGATWCRDERPSSGLRAAQAPVSSAEGPGSSAAWAGRLSDSSRGSSVPSASKRCSFSPPRASSRPSTGSSDFDLPPTQLLALFDDRKSITQRSQRRSRPSATCSSRERSCSEEPRPCLKSPSAGSFPSFSSLESRSGEDPTPREAERREQPPLLRAASDSVHTVYLPSLDPLLSRRHFCITRLESGPSISQRLSGDAAQTPCFVLTSKAGSRKARGASQNGPRGAREHPGADLTKAFDNGLQGLILVNSSSSRSAPLDLRPRVNLLAPAVRAAVKAAIAAAGESEESPSSLSLSPQEASVGSPTHLESTTEVSTGGPRRTTPEFTYTHFVYQPHILQDGDQIYIPVDDSFVKRVGKGDSMDAFLRKENCCPPSNSAAKPASGRQTASEDIFPAAASRGAQSLKTSSCRSCGQETPLFCFRYVFRAPASPPPASSRVLPTCPAAALSAPDSSSSLSSPGASSPPSLPGATLAPSRPQLRPCVSDPPPACSSQAASPSSAFPGLSLSCPSSLVKRVRFSFGSPKAPAAAWRPLLRAQDGGETLQGFWGGDAVASAPPEPHWLGLAEKGGGAECCKKEGDAKQRPRGGKEERPLSTAGQGACASGASLRSFLFSMRETWQEETVSSDRDIVAGADEPLWRPKQRGEEGELDATRWGKSATSSGEEEPERANVRFPGACRKRRRRVIDDEGPEEDGGPLPKQEGKGIVGIEDSYQFSAAATRREADEERDACVMLEAMHAPQRAQKATFRAHPSSPLAHVVASARGSERDVEDYLRFLPEACSASPSRQGEQENQPLLKGATYDGERENCLPQVVYSTGTVLAAHGAEVGGAAQGDDDLEELKELLFDSGDEGAGPEEGRGGIRDATRCNNEIDEITLLSGEDGEASSSGSERRCGLSTRFRGGGACDVSDAAQESSEADDFEPRARQSAPSRLRGCLERRASLSHAAEEDEGGEMGFFGSGRILRRRSTSARGPDLGVEPVESGCQYGSAQAEARPQREELSRVGSEEVRGARDSGGGGCVGDEDAVDRGAARPADNAQRETRRTSRNSEEDVHAARAGGRRSTAMNLADEIDDILNTDFTTVEETDLGGREDWTPPALPLAARHPTRGAGARSPFPSRAAHATPEASPISSRLSPSSSRLSLRLGSPSPAAVASAAAVAPLCSSPSVAAAASLFSAPSSSPPALGSAAAAAPPKAGEAEGLFCAAGDICAICTEELFQRDEIGTLPSCPHQFCFTCISRWGGIRNHCPLCKQEFTRILRHHFAVPPRRRSSSSHRPSASSCGSSPSSQRAVAASSGLVVAPSSARRSVSSPLPSTASPHRVRLVLDGVVRVVRRVSAGHGQAEVEANDAVVALLVTEEEGTLEGASSRIEVFPAPGGCQVCGRDTDWDNLLLCDGCEDGYHLYCLTPRFLAVPEGAWYCLRCREVSSTAEATTRETIARERTRLLSAASMSYFLNDDDADVDLPQDEPAGGGEERRRSERTRRPASPSVAAFSSPSNFASSSSAGALRPRLRGLSLPASAAVAREATAEGDEEGSRRVFALFRGRQRRRGASRRLRPSRSPTGLSASPSPATDERRGAAAAPSARVAPYNAFAFARFRTPTETLASHERRRRLPSPFRNSVNRLPTVNERCTSCGSEASRGASPQQAPETSRLAVRAIIRGSDAEGAAQEDGRLGVLRRRAEERQRRWREVVPSSDEDSESGGWRRCPAPLAQPSRPVPASRQASLEPSAVGGGAVSEASARQWLEGRSRSRRGVTRRRAREADFDDDEEDESDDLDGFVVKDDEVDYSSADSSSEEEASCGESSSCSDSDRDEELLRRRRRRSRRRLSRAPRRSRKQSPCAQAARSSSAYGPERVGDAARHPTPEGANRPAAREAEARRSEGNRRTKRPQGRPAPAVRPDQRGTGEAGPGRGDARRTPTAEQRTLSHYFSSGGGATAGGLGGGRGAASGAPKPLKSRAEAAEKEGGLGTEEAQANRRRCSVQRRPPRLR